MTEMPVQATPATEAASKGTVAYLGPVASFTHQAMLQDFPEGTGWAYKSCATIKDIVATVAAGDATFGVVPFENSTYGPVVDTLDLLAASPTAYPGLIAIAESYISVHHALVGRRPPEDSGALHTRTGAGTGSVDATTESLPVSTPDINTTTPDPAPAHSSTSTSTSLSTSTSTSTSNPTYFSSSLTTAAHNATPNSSGAATPTPREPSPARPRTKPRYSLSHITTVLSHPQGFGQCAAFLAAYLKHAERHETASTAAAAARVAAHPGIDQAAIASVAAGTARGLDVLAEQIEDLAGNRTRFLTLTLRDAGSMSVGKGKKKFLVSFRLRPAAPAGALAAALAVFDAHGLDLTSIHPRPSGVRAWDYVFVVECVSEGEGDGDKSDRIEKALRDLAERVERCALLGRYRDRGAE